MNDTARRLTLAGEMTYSAGSAAFALIWPHLSVMWYRPTVEHYKEGFPTAEELELDADERLVGVPERVAQLRGEMTVQDCHATIISAFGLETVIRGIETHTIWMVSLDDADAGIRRPRC
ncbi:MAG: hypothetical protein JWM11_7767 [Planctomycetaceae bacterium]|nr:hypothetical protein [Planctomycetaceae bacterium]